MLRLDYNNLESEQSLLVVECCHISAAIDEQIQTVQIRLPKYLFKQNGRTVVLAVMYLYSDTVLLCYSLAALDIQKIHDALVLFDSRSYHNFFAKQSTYGIH